MTIPSLDLQGSYYQISFDYYQNPLDSVNFYWILDAKSVGVSQYSGSDCAVMDNDWKIMIPKIEFGSSYYQITLNYYQNPNNPFGFHWMLDLSSIAATQ